LTVPDSASDAALDWFHTTFDSTEAFHFFGQPGNPIPTNGCVGVRFAGVTLTAADTVTGARLSLVKDTTEWYNIPHRWAVIDQDNTATFSSGSPPGSRPVVTASIAAETVNVNHTNGSTYVHPTTGGLQTTLGNAVAAVLARGGWASGNAIAIVDQSDQDASAQAGSVGETYSTWDAPTALAPQIIIDYTPGAASTTLPVRRRAPMRVWTRRRVA
jgi:hypothetical protein